MNSLSALHRLQQTSTSLHSSPVPVSVEYPPVKKQMQLLTEMTFIYVLKLLGVEDEKTLAEIVVRLREGTPFYNFTFLAHNLAKSKTDFDFLTDPENLAAYAKIAEVSHECNVELLPYVNVLARIAENKQYGLYSENQEVGFFLDEYARCKDSVDATEFLHQFKKILKYRTQVIFEKFIRDGIFSVIQKTLSAHLAKITSEQVLALYVYGLRYYDYDAEISNADENFLIEHIGFFVNYLSKQGEIEFKTQEKESYFPSFASDDDAVTYFFEHDEKMKNSLENFIGFLKDVCPLHAYDDVNNFCIFLRNNLSAQNGKIFDDRSNKFLNLISKNIRKRTETEKNNLYEEIKKLLPARILPDKILCMRSPNIIHRNGKSYYVFNDLKHYGSLFYASEDGCKTGLVPQTHKPIEVEVFEENDSGYADSWMFRER